MLNFSKTRRWMLMRCSFSESPTFMRCIFLAKKSKGNSIQSPNQHLHYDQDNSKYNKTKKCKKRRKRIIFKTVGYTRKYQSKVQKRKAELIKESDKAYIGNDFYKQKR